MSHCFWDYNVRWPKGNINVEMSYCIHSYTMCSHGCKLRNEEEVGQGIKDSNLKREQIFVVTKLWEQNGYDYCLKAFDASLKQ